jgi:hypothetical protein
VPVVVPVVIVSAVVVGSAVIVNSHVVTESCLVVYSNKIQFKGPKLEVLVAKFLSITIKPPTVYYPSCFGCNIFFFVPLLCVWHAPSVCSCSCVFC